MSISDLLLLFFVWDALSDELSLAAIAAVEDTMPLIWSQFRTTWNQSLSLLADLNLQEETNKNPSSYLIISQSLKFEP